MGQAVPRAGTLREVLWVVVMARVNASDITVYSYICECGFEYRSLLPYGRHEHVPAGEYAVANSTGSKWYYKGDPVPEDEAIVELVRATRKGRW